MQTFQLAPHPAFPPSSVRSIEVEMTDPDWGDVLIDFHIVGENVVIPEWHTPERREELWKSTCFEFFIRETNSDRYFEFNFAPSTHWAAYSFEGYRKGMRELVLPVEPHIEFDPGRPFDLSVDLDFDGLPNVPMMAGLSAVIEELDGTISYWALAHPPGGKPDFHHRDCFVIEIPPARAP